MFFSSIIFANKGANANFIGHPTIKLLISSTNGKSVS